MNRSMLAPAVFVTSALAGCTPGGVRDACAPYRGAGDATVGSNRAEWMTELTCRHADRELTLMDLCWPRSHDAGTYVESSCFLGNACNTKTQDRTMAGQLEAGIRAFDIRVQKVNPGDFGVDLDLTEPRYFTHHTNTCGGVGCLGAPVDQLLAELRTFLDHHRELVLLELTHSCQTGWDDAVLVQLIADTLGDRLYREPVGETRPLAQRPLSDLLPGDAPLGRVLVVHEGLPDTPAYRQEGRFPSSFLPVNGYWSNTTDLSVLESQQLARWANFQPDGSTFFELSWTLTQDQDLALACTTMPASATSIEDLASVANAALPSAVEGLLMSGAIGPGHVPNVLSVDFGGDWVTDLSVRITEAGLR